MHITVDCVILIANIREVIQMQSIANSISLQSFYPENLNIMSIEQDDSVITIHIKSKTKECKCPSCNSVSGELYATHHKKVQDLPILGKRVVLDLTLYEFKCNNPDCNSVSFTESCSDFLNDYCYMTNRLVDLVCTLALETSCESCARILQSMSVKISGDTVIRTLIKRYDRHPTTKCGSAIGVDDFAFKKRHTYGTIIVDAETHKTVAILDGRDGTTLKEWLENNKQVKTVTRDRASAYAKAVEEILPDCMQIADRFHLHKNLMDAVNKILGREIPATTAIMDETSSNSHSDKATEDNEPCKKNRIHCG